MTVPSGSSGSGYSLAGIDGVLFGNTTGAISGMQNLSQAVVQAAKMAEIEANAVLTTILNTVFDGLRNGVSLALAIIESIAVKLFGLIPGFTTVTQALNAILEVPVLSDLVHALTGIVGGTYSDITTWAGIVGGAVADLAALITGLGGTVIGDVVTIISTILTNIAQFFSIFGAGFPKTFPFTFGTSTSTTLADFTPLGQFQQLLDGIANNGAPGNTIDSAVAALQQTYQTIHSDISQAIQDGVAGIEGAGAAITQSFQNFPGQNVQGVTIGESVLTDLQAVVDGGVNALNATTGVIGAAVGDFETQFSNFLTTQFNNWTGNNIAAAGAADISAAALSAAEQLASLSTQAANIAAQLPQFYGGSGAAGIGIEVPFVAGVPQGAGNAFTAISSTQSQYSGTNGYSGTASAQTESETVSGIWSKIIPGNTWRGVYLRANAAGTTRVWGRWRVVGSPGAGSSGGYYIPNDTAAYFQFQIGCDVAGTPTVLQTFGPYPLWAYAGEVVVTGYSIQYIGEWWANYPQYLPTYGPGYVADTGHSMYLNSGNNSISLEATADTFSLLYPGAGEISKIDTGPVSLMGSSYRQAGFTDDAGVPGTQVSWAFWDSGPTAGPQNAPLATQQGTPSLSWTNLATVGPTATVNIGLSGMALVTVSAHLFNDTDGSEAEMGFSASGANTIATGAGNQNTLRAGTYPVGASAQTLLTDLLPGPTTFATKYQAITAGTASFSNRDITAIPL